MSEEKKTIYKVEQYESPERMERVVRKIDVETNEELIVGIALLQDKNSGEVAPFQFNFPEGFTVDKAFNEFAKYVKIRYDEQMRQKQAQKPLIIPNGAGQMTGSQQSSAPLQFKR